MSARIYEALLECDEHYYRFRNGLQGAKAALRALVEQDPDEARNMLKNLRGCRRTVQRHSMFLREALGVRMSY